MRRGGSSGSVSSAAAWYDRSVDCLEPGNAAHGPVRGDVAPNLGGQPLTHAGRYVLIEHLGSGSMGHVYRAYDPDLAREVALKFLRSDADSTAEAVLREARLMASVSHQNVVSVYDFGYTNDTAFIAMELVKGTTLLRWLQARSRHWREILDVYCAAGSGLAAAHVAGLVHRDFKASNVLIGDDGSVHVADFGVARLQPAGLPPQKLSVGEPGTVSFMAPEVRDGTAANPLSDQYSYCVSLYAALFGALPTAETIAGPRGSRLSTVVPRGRLSVPGWLRRVVERGLRSDPGDRWPSMAKLVSALRTGRHRRRRRQLIVAGLVGTIVVWLSPAIVSERDSCAASDTAVAAIWNPTRVERLQAAFRSQPHDSVQAGLTRVTRAIENYVLAWQEAKSDACLGRGASATPELFDEQMTCLDGRLQRVDALLNVIEAGDEGVLRDAVVSVTQLPELGDCADDRYLRRHTKGPLEPGTPLAIERARAEVERLLTLRDAGLHERALRRAIELESVVEALSYPPLVVDLALLRAELEHHAGDGHLAYETARQAYFFATARHDERSAQEAATQLVFIASQDLARYQTALEWSEHASALLERDGSSSLSRARLLRYTAHAMMGLGDTTGAAALLHRAYETVRAGAGPTHPAAASVVASMGICRFLEGRHAEALLQFSAAYPTYIELYGESHPRTATLLASTGRAHAGLGHRDRAEQHLRRALVVIEQAYGTASELAESIRNELALLPPT